MKQEETASPTSRRARRPTYTRELQAWTLLAVALGAVEGALVGVILKNLFAVSVNPLFLNFAVAVVSGAPALANVFSFFWASFSHGRDKIRVLSALQFACVGLALLIAFAPIDSVGVLLIVTGVVGARICWSGVVTVRAVIWRANYPRNVRARVTGVISILFSTTMGLTGLVLGLLMNVDSNAFRWFYPGAMLCGLAGAWLYRGVRVRSHRSLLAAEKSDVISGFRLLQGWSILRNDSLFRRYMSCMFIFGSGNLMLIAPLILIFNEKLHLPRLQQMLIISSVPLLAIPFTTPLWARLLDRIHVVAYRALHSWSFVAAALALTSGSWFGSPVLLWLGALLMGTAYAGGILGWNLGHNDFAPRQQAAQYMGVHVTLTGIRGLIMPLVGVGFYELIEAHWPGQGALALILPLSLIAGGAAGFVWMDRTMRRSGTSWSMESS